MSLHRPRRGLPSDTVKSIIPKPYLHAISLYQNMRPPSILLSSRPHSFTLRNHLIKVSLQYLSVLRQEAWGLELVSLCSFKLSSKSVGIHSSHDIQVGQTNTVHLVEHEGYYFPRAASWHMGKPSLQRVQYVTVQVIYEQGDGDLWGTTMSCGVLVNEDIMWQDTWDLCI